MRKDRSPISGIGKRRDGRFYPKEPTEVSFFGVLSGVRGKKNYSRLWDVMLSSTMEQSKRGVHNYTTKIRDMILYTNYSANKWLQDEIIKNYPKLAPSQVLQKELDIIHGKFDLPIDIKLRKQWLSKRTAVPRSHPHNLADLAPDDVSTKEIENYEKFRDTGIIPSQKEEYDDDSDVDRQFSTQNLFIASMIEKDAQKLTDKKTSPF